MLAFMAYPPPRERATSAKQSLTANSENTSSNSFSQPCSNNNDSVTTASLMDEAPPQSMLSVSTHASSVSILEKDPATKSRRNVIQEALEEEEDEAEIQRRANTCCVGPELQLQKQHQSQQQPQQQPQHQQHLLCHVAMCEMEHLDLFMVREFCLGSLVYIVIHA